MNYKGITLIIRVTKVCNTCEKKLSKVRYNKNGMCKKCEETKKHRRVRK